MKRWQKMLSYGATGVASFILLGFTIAQKEPAWWGAVVGVVPMLVAVLIGKPWRVPEA